MKKKFIKNKLKKSKKKKPISKSRSKAKGKSAIRAKKGKSALKKKGKKGKSQIKKKKPKKKKIKKVKKKKDKIEQEEPEVAIEKIMLGGVDLEPEEREVEKRNQQFFQEMQMDLEPEPEIMKLQVQNAGEIDRENEREAGVLVSLSKNRRQFDVENQPGMHVEYQTEDALHIKLAFGPEDQIIEHIFTMHWSQIDKILLRAKVAGKVAPPSKRMTILEAGEDVYSKERKFLGRPENLREMEFEDMQGIGNQDEELVRETRGISEIQRINVGGAGRNEEADQTQGEIKEIVTELILGGKDTEHMRVLDSR